MGCNVQQQKTEEEKNDRILHHFDLRLHECSTHFLIVYSCFHERGSGTPTGMYVFTVFRAYIRRTVELRLEFVWLANRLVRPTDGQPTCQQKKSGERMTMGLSRQIRKNGRGFFCGGSPFPKVDEFGCCSAENIWGPRNPKHLKVPKMFENDEISGE